MTKKLIYLLSGLLIILISFNSCKSKKSLQKGTKSSEIVLPLSGNEYETNKEFFRARQSGKSPDMPTSKKIALQNAKAELASNIQATIKRVTDQYTNQRTVGNAQEFKNKFEELAREVVNVELTESTLLAEKLFKEKDGSYTTWVVVQVGRESVLNNLTGKISKDQKLQLDFDKYQYEKIFNEEMKKFEENK